MAKIIIVDSNDNKTICSYESDVSPRVGDCIQFGSMGAVRKVKSVGHLIDIPFDDFPTRGFLRSVMAYVTKVDE